MARLVWGDGPKFFESGVDQGVLYLDNTGVPWNGLVSVDEKASGSVDADYYYDGNRLWVSQETGDFEATISAYTYPDVFAEYNGYSDRETYKRFGFAYRVQNDDGHKLHIIYNALVDDSDRAWSTTKQAPDPSVFQWDISGTAVPIPGASPTARLTLEIGHDDAVLQGIENILYGTDGVDPRLPDPAELYELYESATVLRIRYNDDGSYTADGPDSMVRLLDDGAFKLNAPSVFLDEQDIFTVSSY